MKRNNKLFWILVVSAITYFLQGVSSLPSQAFFVYLKNILKLNPSEIMVIGSIVSLAWLVKPIFGVVIDKSGISKKLWILGSVAIDIAIFSSLGMGFFPLTTLVVLLAMSNTCAAVRDISVDGIMCVEGKKVKSTGKIQALQWISITVALILVGLVGGEIAQRLTYQSAYLLLIPIMLIGIIPILKMKESKLVKSPNWKDCIRTLTNKKFVLVCLFLFLYKFSPSFGTPLLFIQRDTFHWSERFIGVFGAIISVMEVIGALLYFKFSKQIDIKKWLKFSVFLGAAVTLCYLWYTPITALVYGIVFAVVGMLIHLIVMDFMARESVRGLETTSFALLCSISNLAGTASTLSGAYLLPKIGLPSLIIISSLTSFACLFLINKVRFK